MAYPTTKLGTTSPNPKTPKLQIPKLDYINLNLINPVQDDVNGGVDEYRWGRNNPKEIEAIRMHQDSFLNYGLLGAFPTIKVPSDFTATQDGKDFLYEKGTYITVDYAGRLRTLKNMESLGTIMVSGPVPICDVSETVLGNEKEITATVRERLWDAVITLSTGNNDWNVYNFISSGAEMIVDPYKKSVFTYFRDSMRKYSGAGLTLTNNNVINSLRGRMPKHSELRRHELDYDMKYKRYSTLTLNSLSNLRHNMTRADLPATFIDKLGMMILQSAKQGYFTGCDHTRKNDAWVRLDKTEIQVFPMSNGKIHKLYSDAHYFLFEEGLEKILHTIMSNCPKSIGGYSSDLASSKREIEMKILEASNLFKII
jgi:hypothetical protein